MFKVKVKIIAFKKNTLYLKIIIIIELTIKQLRDKIKALEEKTEVIIQVNLLHLFLLRSFWSLLI